MAKDERLATLDSLIRHLDTGRLHLAEEELTRLHGARYTEYRSQWKAAGEFGYVPPFPLYLFMEATYRCNLRCCSCVHGYPELRQRYSFPEARMSWELYEKVVLEGEANGCPSISTHNNDEPLLLPDLEKRIAFAREHGFMDVIMTTNGVLFTEERVRSVMEAGVTRMLFSIDALTEETYRKVRPGGDLAKVRRALEWTLEQREHRGSRLPIVRVSFVVNRHNQHELGRFVEHYAKIVDYIDIQPYYTWKGANDALVPEGARPVRDFRCNGPWRELVVRANGDVLPCPNFYGAEVVVGNVHKTPLKEIFQSPAVAKLREEFRQGIHSHPACAACSKGCFELDWEAPLLR